MSINTSDDVGAKLGSEEGQPLLGGPASPESVAQAARVRSLKAVLLTNFLSATGVLVPCFLELH